MKQGDWQPVKSVLGRAEETDVPQETCYMKMIPTPHLLSHTVITLSVASVIQYLNFQVYTEPRPVDNSIKQTPELI